MSQERVDYYNETYHSYSLLGLLTVFKPKPLFSAKTEENRNRNFSWA